jgi:quercetin dioxygenase-like cupin family protein
MVEYKQENPDKHDKKREELYAKVLSLKDVVSYQDGTVASRMIINKKAGSITIFSFDENEGLSEHTSPYDAVVTIIDGECGQSFFPPTLPTPSAPSRNSR